ncbi:hypothetical protein M3Y98_00071100 [Aphelenchoides besseyi]|nr:hypothetical protein M3Y98_00071100 [Aphelenchoides besseyi]KAI6198758.1 hypothetical protein M3Y96_00553300 [Aphelenchoides besseyi]
MSTRNDKKNDSWKFSISLRYYVNRNIEAYESSKPEMQPKTFVLCTAVLLVLNSMADAAKPLNCYTCDTSGQHVGFDVSCHKPKTQMTCYADASCVKIEQYNGVMLKGCLADVQGVQWHHETGCWTDAYNSRSCNGAMGQMAVGSGVLLFSIVSYVLVQFAS